MNWSSGHGQGWGFPFKNEAGARRNFWKAS